MDNSIKIAFQKTSIWKLILSIALCELTGIVSSILSGVAINPWFDSIMKPSWNPPSYVFGPVWSVLYLLMGISLWLVWKSNNSIGKKVVAVTFFFMQLLLNFCWSVLFFKFHSPLLALLDIGLLLILIVITMIHFYKISKTATYLLIPYVIWVAFATALNCSIWILNR